MSDNEMVKFDPSQLADQLKAKIRFELSKVLPEEVWEGLIKKEIDLFMNDTIVKEYGRAQTIQSGIGKVVCEILTEESRKRLKEILNSDDWRNQWVDTGNRETVGEAVKELLIKGGPIIFASFVGEVVTKAIDAMRQQTY